MSSPKATLTQLLILLLSSVSLFAHALESDRQQPVFIEADQFELDNRSGITIYTGNVEMQQGSLRIEADKITLYRDQEGAVDRIHAEGKRAHFQQQPAPDKAVIHAYALKINYFAASEKVELIDDARLEQARDSFDGERIDYFIQTQKINAYSGRQAGQKQRVEIVIHPKQKPAEP